MKLPAIKSAIRILTLFTAAAIIVLIGIAIFYFFKPVGPAGNSCTHDDLVSCETTTNLIIVLNCLFYAVIIGAVYGIVRLVAWPLARYLKSRERV